MKWRYPPGSFKSWAPVLYVSCVLSLPKTPERERVVKACFCPSTGAVAVLFHQLINLVIASLKSIPAKKFSENTKLFIPKLHTSVCPVYSERFSRGTSWGCLKMIVSIISFSPKAIPKGTPKGTPKVTSKGIPLGTPKKDHPIRQSIYNSL